MLCWLLPLKDGTCNSNELSNTSRYIQKGRLAETLSFSQRSEDSASETTASVRLQACAIYCAVFHRHILQIIDYCPAVVSISELADLKKKQTLQAYKWQYFFWVAWLFSRWPYLILSLRPWALLLRNINEPGSPYTLIYNHPGSNLIWTLHEEASMWCQE